MEMHFSYWGDVDPLGINMDGTNDFHCTEGHSSSWDCVPCLKQLPELCCTKMRCESGRNAE